MSLAPLAADLRRLSEEELRQYLISTSGTDKVDILISCAPCTGFSRVIRKNLVEDDYRNSLVSRSALFVKAFLPSLFLMENVGELLEGKFTHHFELLRTQLEEAGYTVHGAVHTLSKFGVPQTRKRALVIAVRRPLPLHTLEELWEGFTVRPEAITVRRAIGQFPRIKAGERHSDDPWHVSPGVDPNTLKRLKLIPRNGGSWPDILKHPEGWDLLIPSMRRYAEQGKVGSHPDVYGRLAWDQPAITVKRECSHTGNGRYAHPEQHRLCTVRELSVIQGFPRHYKFVARSLSNMYRHIGDAVPPLISFQLAHLSAWMLTGKRPQLAKAILRDTHLGRTDLAAIRGIHQQMPLVESA